ncbi:unnamed protein product, partial [Prorocentrum cordatum]
GLVNYIARCPASPPCPACPALTCQACGACQAPACPGLSCPTCPACPGLAPAAGPAAWPACPQAPEAAPCAGRGWGLLWFVCGVAFGLAAPAALLSARRAARCCRRRRRAAIQVWHQRLVLGQVALSAGKLFVIATPDRHVYAEDYSAGSADVAAVRWATAFNVLPDGIPPGDVYRFRAEPTVAQRAAFLAAAVPEAAGECAGLRPKAWRPRRWTPTACCRSRWADPRPARGLPRWWLLRARPLLPGVVAVGAADGRGAARWVAAECFGGFRVGDDVPHQAGAGAIGDKDIHRLADGSGLFVQYLRPADEQEFFDRIVASDARILPVRRNRLGRRERTWADMCAAVTKEDFGKDWTLGGVRTAGWCLEHINSEGGSLDAHHDRFRSLRRLEPNAWGVAEHLETAAVKAGLLVDQLDGTNLVMVEMLLRRMQTIEFAHLERAKEAESKGYSGRLSLEEQQAFSGLSRGSGQLMICLELLDVVRVDVEREAQLNKALRKGREVTPAEALRKLRVASWYDVDSAVLGSYNLASVSPPSGSPAPVPLEDFRGAGGSDMIRDFVQSRLLPSSEVDTRLKNYQVAVPHSDPKLRRVAAFEEFIRALQQRGMVDFSFSCKERVEAFFAHEKSGKLRLVVDCRRSNCHFQDPAPVPLLTGEGLAGPELGEGEELHVGGADLSDAFYHMQLPPDLRPFFCFRAARAGAAGCTRVNGKPVPPSAMVYPRLSVIPMGWSWALWMRQTAHERIVEQAGASPENRIVDKQVTLDLHRACHSQYVDNFIAVSTDASVAAVDASEWGLGACAAQCGASLARSVGRTSERWRWGRVGAAMGPRRHALDHARKAEAAAALAGEAREAAPWIAAANDVPGPECAPPQPPSAGSGVLDSPGDVFGFGRVRRVVDFPEVPRDMIELQWSVVGRFPWRRKGESIAVHEARATLYGFRHLLRSSRNLGKHALVLGDSQSTAGAVTRFRSDSRSMMRVTQAIAALSLATGSALHYRWLPSEWNVADSPSRGLWAPAAPSPLDFSKHAPAGQPRTDLDRRADGGADGPAGLAAGQAGGHPWKRQTVADVAARRRASAVTVGGLTVLESASVRPRTRQKYQSLFAEFLAWLAVPVATSEAGVDQQLVGWLDALHLGGENLGSAQWGFAAVTFFTGLQKSAGALMPRSRRALQGFRRCCPPQSRLPLPREAVALIANELVRLGKLPFAIAIVVIFELYLRPGEILNVRVVDLIPPVLGVASAPCWAITLHAQEVGRSSKTNEFDESMRLDLERHAPLGPALKALCQGRSPGSPIFDFALKDLVTAACGVARSLKLDEYLGDVHLYQLRHGGASHDSAGGFRSLGDVRRRGRWRSRASVRRYEKGSRIGQVLLKLPEDLRAHALSCERSMASIVRGRPCPAAPGPRSNSPPMGLDDLSPADADKVRVGNLLMFFSVAVMRDAMLLGIPATLENPARSRIWICPAMQRLRKSNKINFTVTDFCMRGAQWRKSTSFLSTGLCMDALAEGRCLGTRRGLCKRTGQPHIPIQGKNDKGVFWSKIAEPYPPGLCKALASIYYNAWASSKAELFDKKELVEQAIHRSRMEEENRQRTMLINEQESEYEESLRIDREKAEQKALKEKEEEERARREAEEQEAIRREQAQKEAEAAAEAERRQAKATEAVADARGRLREEPAPSEAGRVLLQIRLPEGRRLKRAFRAADPVEQIYLFARAEAGEALAAQEFRLVSPLPRCTYEDRSATLGSAGLTSGTSLLVEMVEE